MLKRRTRYERAEKQKPGHKAGLSEFWCPNPESNQGHADFQSAALPTELFGQRGALNPTPAAASNAFQQIRAD